MEIIKRRAERGGQFHRGGEQGGGEGGNRKEEDENTDHFGKAQILFEKNVSVSC